MVKRWPDSDSGGARIRHYKEKVRTMSDKYNWLTVVLDHDIGEEEVAEIICAMETI